MFIRVYNTVILYEANGLRCQTIQSLDHCYRGGRCQRVKRHDLKIMLPHRCQILRLMNNTPPQSIMPTGSEYVVVLRNALHIPVRYLLGYRDLLVTVSITLQGNSFLVCPHVCVNRDKWSLIHSHSFIYPTYIIRCLMKTSLIDI